VFGYQVFEPVTILTNLIFFGLCVRYFLFLRRYPHTYASQMGLFILTMGLGSLFGAVAHGVHYQLGAVFFNTVFFLMNGLSLASIYFCFRGPYSYHTLNRSASPLLLNLVLGWVLVLLVISFLHGNFLLIKIHAGITLSYSLGVHYLAYRRRQERGSGLVVAGISIAFLSILVHSLRWSLHAWFNYKDMAHVVMIIALVVIQNGVKHNVLGLEKEEAEFAGAATA